MKKLTVLALFVAVMGLALVSAVRAEDAKEVTVVGTVSVKADADGKVTAIEVAAADATYNVVVNDKSEGLVALKGKKVSVTGTVLDADGKKTLTVTKFEEKKAE
ncbi:MAG: hypothetical protein A3K19_31395 [Lentisphaerae bacterium RIFOXYB12_FULL_65_16]|nr:MAG: hypothetical protein A3K18_10180 [Lentisphaerae bacterium RIFOXYA12_64_32]OGV88551.1 MAG: hypothetical protein A3K19_31395 [Lentisphaerae bacterium RIFOXYB12_FULL_65_16]